MHVHTFSQSRDETKQLTSAPRETRDDTAKPKCIYKQLQLGDAVHICMEPGLSISTPVY